MTYSPYAPQHLPRNEPSRLGRWWLTLDHGLFFAALLLLAIGALLILSSSPAAAGRFDTDPFYFSKRHLVFLSFGFTVLVTVSTLNWRQLLWLCYAGLGLGIAALVFVLFFGTVVDGSRRWIRILGFSIQPIEFVKPVLVVALAHQLALLAIPGGWERALKPLGLVIAVLILLWLQPDVGQSMLICATVGIMLLVAGTSRALLTLGVGAVIGLAGLAITFQSHVQRRVLAFLQEIWGGGSPDLITQEDIAQRALSFAGVGPGEGTIKHHLAAAHTDYVLAVMAEEMGVVTVLFVLALFGFILSRVTTRLRREVDLFHFLAITGLISLLSVQMLMNALSTFRLMPTTGMTLPLISYGGSSLVASCLTVGLLLAFMRANPRVPHGY